MNLVKDQVSKLFPSSVWFVLTRGSSFVIHLETVQTKMVAKWKWIRYVLFPHKENIECRELRSVFLNTQTLQFYPT